MRPAHPAADRRRFLRRQRGRSHQQPGGRPAAAGCHRPGAAAHHQAGRASGAVRRHSHAGRHAGCAPVRHRRRAAVLLQAGAAAAHQRRAERSDRPGGGQELHPQAAPAAGRVRGGAARAARRPAAQLGGGLRALPGRDGRPAGKALAADGDAVRDGAADARHGTAARAVADDGAGDYGTLLMRPVGSVGHEFMLFVSSFFRWPTSCGRHMREIITTCLSESHTNPYNMMSINIFYRAILIETSLNIVENSNDQIMFHICFVSTDQVIG